MEQTKTKEYRHFLKKCLDKGTMKTDAALELAKKYRVSSTYAQSLVYRFFSGEYNSNRRKDGSRNKKPKTTTITKKKKKGSFLDKAVSEITNDIDF